MRGDISRDLSPNDLIAVSTNLILKMTQPPPARRLPSGLIGMTIGFLANQTCLGVASSHRMALAPLLVRITSICGSSMAVAYSWTSAW